MRLNLSALSTTSASDITISDVRLPLDGFAALEREATSLGHNFLTRMAADWASGANRFDSPGECLLGAFASDNLIAIGGLNRDPFANQDTIGRLRHLYVLHDHRRQSVGHQLVEQLVARNRQFQTIRLRTANPVANRFYLSLGFSAVSNDPTASHVTVMQGPRGQ